MFPIHPKMPKMRAQRNQHGMSLATVMAVGVVVMLMVSAMFATIMPLFRSVTSLNSDYKLRATSEMAIDYAIAQLNSGNTNFDVIQAIGSPPSSGSAATIGARTPWMDVPASVLGSNTNATVKVMVAAIGNPPGPVINNVPSTPQYTGDNPSSLYDINLEQKTNVAGNVHGNKGAYRMVLAQATVPGSGATRWVRAILQPTYSSTTTNTVGRVKKPYSLFGVASIVFAGQAGLNTYNFTPGNWVAGGAALDLGAAKQLGAMAQAAADGGSLGKISQVYGGGGLTRSIVEGGAHYEFPNPLSIYNQQFAITGQQYNAKPAVSAPWMQMYGNVYSNGANTAYYPLMGNGDPGSGAYTQSNFNGSQSRPSGISANVFGVSNGIDSSIWNPLANSKTATNAMVPPADLSGNPQPSNPNLAMASRGWSGGLVGFNQVGGTGYTYPQPTMPPPQSAPPATPNLGAVNLTNGAKLVISANASMPPLPLGNINGKTVTLPPGDYMMSSLRLSGGSSVQIDSTTQAAIASGSKNDVNFYLQGTTPPAIAMSVDNTSSVNMNGITGTGINTVGKTGMSNTKATSSNQIAINNPSDASVAGSNINETAGNAQQLNIYSNYGSGTAINLSGNERCVIDAPYTDVNIGSLISNSSPGTIANNANFYGAVYANNIHVQSSYSGGGGAFVHYDYRLHPAGTNNPWTPWGPTLGNNNGVTTTTCSGYRAVSWQEAVRSTVGNQQSLAPGMTDMLPSDLRWSYNF